MKKIILLAFVLSAVSCMSADTITATFYGSEIDLTQKGNPCRGNTDGGVEVVVVTAVSTLKEAPDRTVVERVYKLPNGELLKKECEIVDAPKMVVLHNLFPRQYPKVSL